MQPSTLGRNEERFSAPVQRGRARSTKVSAERRSVWKIRFTAAEWRLVEERARTCGRAPARYVREAALGAVLKVSRTRGNAPAIRELGAIAGALRELKCGVSSVDEGAESDADARLAALVSRVLGVVEWLA
jgi:hypothetical protein